MELFPTGKTLRLICLGAFGPYEVVMTVDQMIPITDHDYAKKHYVGLWLDNRSRSGSSRISWT